MRLRALHMLLCILALACSLPVCASAGTAPGMMPGTFDVTLSGSSSYSVPIKIAPGSAGTQPQLQFLYDSQALGGALGAGWSLGGLSVITRGPHDQFVDGRPSAIGLDEEDALYLDGQRIVPISPPKGFGISRKVEFRKVNDDFSQIEQFGPDLNHSYFRVRSKGGITLVFGNPEIISPRATDPGLLDATIRVADQSVSAFAESAAIDTAGNFVRFHYSSNGFGDYNISDIYYTGHGSIDGTGVINEYQNPYAALTFSYEPAPRPIEAYVGGQLIRKEVRLTNVYSCVFDKPFVDRESCTGSTPTVSERRQATHYRLEYQDTSTAARFTLKQIHMFGTDDGTEISPTNFNYSRPNFGWISNPYTLPVGLVLAATERLGGAYRFVHFAPDTSGTVDLLFSAQIAGKNIGFAFKNNGASSWTAGGIPWTSMSGQGDVDFTPPVAFVSADGGDMGVILADITGTGRAAIIQNNVSGTHSDVHTYLAGPQKFESHDEYKIPFVVSRDGKVVGHYFLANWTGGSGPDMIYDSDGQKGFLRNGGPGVGWQPAADARFVPPIPLDGRSHLIDFACNGGSPLLVGVAPAPSTGKLEWHVYRMGNAGWKEELGANFKPDNPNLKTPIPPTTDPEAIREVSFSNSGSSCKGLLVATAVGAGSHSALSPTPTGWEELDRVPPFDLVDAKGNPSHAIVANLTGDGFSGIIADAIHADGSAIAFAYTQTSSGWKDVSSNFIPSTPLATDDPKAEPIHVYVGPLSGQPTDDIALLNDARPLIGDTPIDQYRKFGHIFINDTSRFVEQPDFAPPVAFARQDKQDLGVRFVDLHGTGLPDLVFSRLKMVDGKAVLMAGAYRNTGHGWVPEPGLCTITAFDISNANPTKPGGLCPPIPFAGDDIAGNPIQFLDLDGDGYLDLIYSYKNKAGVTVTQIYFNVDDGHGGRRWSEQSSDPSNQKRYDLPARVLPLSSFGIGDMGVRFAKFDANRLGILQSFRAAGSVVCKGRQCALQPGPTKTSAFSFDGNGWVDRSDRFAPPVPFVTQSDSPTGPSHDLMVQIVDVRGGGLPAIVASFTDPITKTATSPGAKVNKVWLNTEAGWDASSGITLPYDLDAIYWEPKSLVQFADVNGDGLPDIVMTKGGCLDCSRTWVNTGRGWIEDPNWRVPSEAISNKDGDPGFRLVDIKGDGYLDILWMRQKDDGSFEQGLRLNNGHDWSTKAPDNVVPKQLAFVSKDGVDQGVRLLSVSGKGLTDIVQSFEGRIQTILLNRSRRTDVIDTITDGYGLQTRVYYETLLEVDGADPASGIKEGGPLGWRTYEREAANAYPKVASIPTTYVVRKAVVDEGNGHPSVVDYRYGRYRVDGAALRSLGFGWRETLNEVSSVLNRSEMIQDARAPPRVSRDATCIVRQDILKGPSVNRAETNSATGPFPNDLCPGGDITASSWGYKISENSTCWTITEGDSSGHISEINLPSTPDCRTDSKSSPLTGYIIRQNAISRSRSRTFEVDGRLVSLTTDTFTYDTADSILKRSGDVLNTTSVMADGTSIETENEYTDDWSRWFLGRLTKTTVTKRGDVIDQAGPLRKSETRCSRFEYDRETGLLTAQEVNCGNSRSVTTRFIRDPLGNIVSKITLAAGEQPQTTRLEYDEFGRFEVANTDALGHRSTVRRDPASGQPRSVTDPNNLTATMEYDAFGRLRKQTDPSGVTSISELFAAVPGVLPKVGSAADITDGLTTSVNYAIKTQTGALPPAWTLFDVKGRPIRKVTRGFSANPEKVRFVFQDTDYDGLGRIRRSSLPRFADEPPKWAINQYDDLGRVCASTAINGLRTETIFEGLPGGGARVINSVDPKKQLTDLEVGDGGKKLLACGQVSDPSLYNAEGLDQRSYSTINMRKEIVEASDAVGRITYEYDAGGRLERMRGPTGAVTLNSYDDLGNKVVVSDPDLGVWRYDYDPFGRVVRQVDAKGQKSTIEYDVAGRPVRRVLNDATTSWQYDVAAHGIGKVASTTDSNGYRESYFYDRYGRVVSDAVLIDGEQFTTSTEYDDLGRVTKLTYPSGLIVANSYDAQGFFTKVTDGLSGKLYWTVDDIDALGRVATEDFGNGVTTVKRFHPKDERLSQIEISGRSGVHVLDLTLQYDLVGNLRARRESVERRNERFDYDAINRLVGQVSVQSGRSEYRYDAAGRITFKSGIGDYRYGTQGRSSDDNYSTPFHAVMAVNYGESERNYKYDLNGNMISSRAGHFDYTADNHVKLMYLDEQKWSRFDYGPSGDRFRQFLREGNISEETLYIGLSEKVIDYSPYLNFDMGHPERFSGFERFTRSRSYLVNSSGVFAVVETDDTRSNTQFFDPLRPPTQWYGKLTSTETWYLHADQLGSVVRITDQDGRLRKSYWYDPWGARSERSDNRTGAGETQQLGVSWKRGFTGHEHLDTFSLIHMNGRVYNPILAVFTSVDPVNQMTLDTQTGNGYAYARNNPLRYVDPSGLDFLGIGHAIHEVGKAIGGAATSAWHGITHFGGEAGKWFAENWRVVVVIAVVIVVEVVTLGAATPAVGALGGAILAGMAAGAAGGALGAALYGGSPDEILTGAFKGAIIGGISGAVGYGLGQYFGPVDEMTTTSRIESVAAHGVVGGARSSVTGGDFAGGFIAGAATQAATAFGPDTRIETLNVARAAIVGGTTSAISGDKFANGAIMAALQYEFVEQFTPRSGRVLSYGEKELYGGYFSDDTLNEVRVHEGIVPFWLSSDAEAVTVGNDVYIRPDAPDLQTSRGEAELLGHELTHAEQFRNGMTIIDYLSEAAKNGAGPENKYEAPAYSAGPKFGAAFCLTYERASGCPNVP